MASNIASDRVLVARIAASERWAREPDRKLATQPARDGRFARLLARVDELTPGLPDAERIRRAESLRRADMTRLSLKSAQARRARRDGQAVSAP